MARLFVAVSMPYEVRREIARIQEQFQECNLFEARYINPEIAHATLVFIGDVSVHSIDGIKKALATVQQQKMKAQLKAVNVFCSAGKGRVLYLSFVCDGIDLLVSQLEEVLAPWKDKKERDFIPHITLARIKKLCNVYALHEVLSSVFFKDIAFSIESFTLEQSVLLPEGPQYETLERYFLS